jgi:Na+-driven multidrug efflux pump
MKKTKLYSKIIKQQTIMSIPLIGQELLEGSIFVVFINAIISKIGLVELGSYLLVKGIIDIALMAMYMYGAATLTLVSEKVGNHDFNSVKKLPYDGIKIAMIIYIVISLFIIIFKSYVPRIISNDLNLINYASKIIILMVLVNLFNPMQTVYKYALQACNDGKYVLYITAMVNLGILILICLLTFVFNIGIVGVFLSLFINYLLLMLLYTSRYKKVLYKLMN